MSKLTKRITRIMTVTLADLKIWAGVINQIELLERDLRLAQEQNLDLRRKLKKLKPVGRSE